MCPLPSALPAMPTSVPMPRIGWLSDQEGFTHSGSFIGDAIPAKKRRNAVSKFGGPVSEGSVLLLSDGTVFGSATDGAHPAARCSWQSIARSIETAEE